jgi:hypothetical protein
MLQLRGIATGRIFYGLNNHLLEMVTTSIRKLVLRTGFE